MVSEVESKGQSSESFAVYCPVRKSSTTKKGNCDKE